MLNDRNDYATTPARQVIRSLLFRTGLSERLGSWWWRPTSEASYITTVFSREVTMFAGMPTIFDDEEFTAAAQGSAARWSRYTETITAAERVIVEPNRCQVIGPDGRLVSQFDPHRGLQLYPSAWQHRRRTIKHQVGEAIVFDGSAGRNYYHFIVDSLMVLAWLQDEPGLLPPDLPLIINRRIADHPFFRHLRTVSHWFDERHWIILEPGESAAVGRAYSIRAAPFRNVLWRRVRDLYGWVSAPKSRRLFVSRDRRRFGRGVRNEAQVAELLTEYGFETFYAEHHTVAEQQAAFEESDFLVGLHGMALVQQFFMRENHGKLLELMPRGRSQVEYGWQSWLLGRHGYDVLVGSEMDSSMAYEVDVARLRTKLEAMLALGPDERQFGSTLLPRDAK